ncbi:MAG: hypothetical protein R6V19_05050 [Armatimonadota bacterium]
MLYAQPDRWLNDPRLLYHEGAYHLFHLQGPRDWPKPPYEEMAHAVSGDLVSWQGSQLLLKPGEAGSWDDRAIYTSGYIYHDGRYWTLYTGLKESEEGRIQRIGVAWSEDLVSWERHPDNPVLQPDPRWYVADPDDADYGHVGWRDPWIYHHTDGNFYAFFTALTKDGPAGRRGCIGLAKSPDMIHWQCLPPAYAPELEDQHEVPELFPYQGKWILIFGTKDNGLGMKYIVSDNPLQWDHDDPGRIILGGPGRMEYSMTTAPAVGDNDRDAIHLVYEWRDDVEGNPRARGRVALPKQLAGPPEDLRLQIRDDIRPREDDAEDPTVIFAGSSDHWELKNDTIIATPGDDIARLIVPGEEPRAVSATVTMTGSGEVGFCIGQDENIITLTHRGQLIADTPAVDQRRGWEVADSSGELTVAMVNKHADIYFNGRYMGTVCAVEAGDKVVQLYGAGEGSFLFKDVRVRPIEIVHSFSKT